MPQFLTSLPYQNPKPIQYHWDTFKGGLNSLLKDTEIQSNEVAQADNIIMKGLGIPTKRWGTSLYYQAGNATGSVRGLKGIYYANGTVELAAITDDGFFTIMSGASYTRVNGVSWASGSPVQMVQQNNQLYIVNGQRPLVRYGNPTLVGFATIGVPTGLGASNLSNASGTNSLAYRVSALSQVGETLASTEVLLPNQPDAPGGVNGGTVRLQWTGVSTASGILQGYNIWGRRSGFESFLGSVDATSTTFIDDGSAIPSTFAFTPLTDSTGGPTAKYIERYQDRIILGNIVGAPTRVMISGRVPYQERFDVAFGGNFIDIEPQGGDPITGIKQFRDKIVVFKERSIWRVTLEQQGSGASFVLVPTLELVTNSHGCIAPNSIQAVETDVYFMTRRGINTLGYQQGYAFDLLRSNEISLKVRPFFQNLTTAQKKAATSFYRDFKYGISIPGLAQTMVFDVERGCWTGPWTTDGNIYENFIDGNGDPHLLYGGSSDVNVQEYSENFTSDNGTAIQTTLRTKRESWGDWSSFKNLEHVFFEFQNISGTPGASIRLEKRSGSVLNAKSFNIVAKSGNSGWGADQFGVAEFGNTLPAGGGTDALQTIRWYNPNTVVRTMNITITTTGAADNYELLGIRGQVTPVGMGILPSSWRI